MWMWMRMMMMFMMMMIRPNTRKKRKRDIIELKRKSFFFLRKIIQFSFLHILKYLCHLSLQKINPIYFILNYPRKVYILRTDTPTQPALNTLTPLPHFLVKINNKRIRVYFFFPFIIFLYLFCFSSSFFLFHQFKIKQIEKFFI